MATIKTIIFDFGDVFINLDKEGALANALALFNTKQFTEAMLKTNEDYEKGLITSDAFLQFYTNTFPHLSTQTIFDAWQFILKDFPKYRLEWLQQLKAQSNYNLILLSNTNALHINHIKKQIPFYNDFKNCFDAFYLSHEIGLRKPNTNIYEFVLKENNLKANECLFIDDTKENTDAANTLNIHTWNINPKTEDVVHLFTTKQHLF